MTTQTAAHCNRDRLACPDRQGWPCAIRGCTRAVPVSPTGTRFAHCDAHTRAALSAAFGNPDKAPVPAR